MSYSQCSCGGVVSERFHTIFGAPDRDQVYACPSCTDWRGIAHGAALSPENDGRRRSWRPGADAPTLAVGEATRSPAGDDRDTIEVLLDDVRGELERRYADEEGGYSHDDDAFAALVMEA